MEFHDFSQIVKYSHFSILLNQARVSLQPAHAWFLNIVSVQMSVCVCVSAPEAINN